MSHVDGEGAPEDSDPGGQDQVLGIGGRPQGQGAHGEHHGQEPGHTAGVIDGISLKKPLTIVDH